jgi:hypothetical protein
MCLERPATGAGLQTSDAPRSRASGGYRSANPPLQHRTIPDGTRNQMANANNMAGGRLLRIARNDGGFRRPNSRRNLAAFHTWAVSRFVETMMEHTLPERSADHGVPRIPILSHLYR